jgi:tetratricopeptide (TPR) repeat protein
MPPSADVPAGASDTELLARAGTALEAGRTEEAAGLLAQVGAGVQHLYNYWLTKASLAATQGAHSEAVAALQGARDRYRQQYGADSEMILLTLARLAIAAGQADVAAKARAEAEAVILPRASQATVQPSEAMRTLNQIDLGLARLLWQEDRHDAAIAAYVRHSAFAPEDLTALRPLRRALALRDRLVEAMTVQMRIALLEPDRAGPARDMGQILRGLGLAAAARAWFRRALALQPDDPATLALLEEGGAPAGATQDPLIERLARPLEGLGGAPGDLVWPMAVARALQAAAAICPATAVQADWALLAADAAEAAFRRVLALRGDHGEAAASLARLAARRPESHGVVPALRAALKLSPRDADLHVRLGIALRRTGKPAEAQRSFRIALALEPDLAIALFGQADAMLAIGPDQEALPLLDRAHALNYAEGGIYRPLLRALALMAHRRMEEALAEIQAALVLDPGHAEAQFACGIVLLSMGRLEEGWPHYAWRWLASPAHEGLRKPSDPLRRPDPAGWAGKTVLVYAEQGLGDTIQFLRYARMVAACGARVLLEVQGPLKRVAQSVPDMAGVYAREDMMPPFDVAVPLMELPWAFGTTLENIPATVPYLRGDLTRAAQFRRRLAGLPGLKVGLVWAGAARPDRPDQAAMDARRSVTLAALAPLARVPGVILVSLQKGDGAAQAATPPEGMVLHNWTDELEDFSDTAALMTALDLVISVDTSTVHLAGALGRPVWLLNRYDTDFRWLLDRDDCPWYPTMRQFRQARPGAWDEVIERVAAALRERAGQGA